MTNPRFRISYGTKLMLIIVGLSFLLGGLCLFFQYNREKTFAAQLLDAKLQLLNTSIIDHLEDGYKPEEWIPGLELPVKGAIVTVIDRKNGTVLYHSNPKTHAIGSHLERPEVKLALQRGERGSAYTMRRPAWNDEERIFFFSVLVGEDIIVRTGAPANSVSVSQFLSGDSTFIWFMLCALTVEILIGYFATRHIGSTIKRLSEFARRAERGENINEVGKFPNDELGIISQTIVRLYVRLQQTTAERDRQQLALMEEEETKQRIKRDLTNNINHELKTPVASMQITLEALMEHPNLPEEKRRQLMERCASNAKRLGSLLRDVSTVTRMDEASSLIGRESIDLAKIIEDIVDDLTPRAIDKKMSIYCSLPRTMNMKGNIALLESVFRNLVENAINYSEGSKITISTLRANPEMFTIVVADDGKGIEEKHLPRLFERFYRIDKGRSRAQGGTGLGLAIVKNACVFHGGDVEVRNRSVGGLEFIISLPREVVGKSDDDVKGAEDTTAKGKDMGKDEVKKENV